MLEKLRHDLLERYPEDERRINAMIDYFLGYDSLTYIIKNEHEDNNNTNNKNSSKETDEQTRIYH